jgi:hypothetical protein
MICGTYGYGSWAGARLIQDESFLQRCEQLEAEHQAAAGGGQWIPLECLFSIRIFDKRPMTPEILILRPIE